jgi:hypothetical protein
VLAAQVQDAARKPDSRGSNNEALRASSGILKYSFGFLALVLSSTALAGGAGPLRRMPCNHAEQCCQSACGAW